MRRHRDSATRRGLCECGISFAHFLPTMPLWWHGILNYVMEKTYTVFALRLSSVMNSLV